MAEALFAAALADFREHAADRIQLRVLQSNLEGQRFWQKIGFRPNLIVYELEGATAPGTW